MMRDRCFIVFFVLVLSVATFSGCTSKENQVADHFEKGKMYAAQNQNKEAVLEFKNVIQQNPDNDAAYLELGRVYMKMGEVLLAVQSYDAAVKHNPENVDAHLKLGQVLLTAKNTMAARKAAKIVLEKRPNDIEGLLLLAAVQLQENNAQGAIKTLTEAIAAHPHELRARLFLANLYTRGGDKGAAETTYLNAISSDPAAPEPYIELIRLYATGDQWKSISPILNQLVTHSRKYHSNLDTLAQWVESKKQLDVAEKIFQHAAATASADNPLPLVHLSGFYAHKRDYKTAMSVIQQALKIDPNGVEAHTALAQMYLETGKIESAEASINKALEINPENIHSVFVRGVIDFHKKDFSTAKDRFDEIIKKSPDTVMAYYYKALCLMRGVASGQSDGDLFRAAAGYHDDAGAWVEKLVIDNLNYALERDPSLLPAKMILAEIYLRDQDTENATRQIEGILALTPNNEKALTLEGSLKLLQKDYNGAEAVCRKVLAQAPDNSQWLTRLGVIQALKQKPEDALIVCQKAMDINPMQWDALQLAVDLHLLANNYDKALAQCETQKEKTKDTPKAAAVIDALIGKIFLAKKDPEAARRSFQQALAIEPNYILPRMYLANIDISENKFDDAAKELHNILEINKNYLPAAMALGDIHYLQGDNKQAEKLYRNALDIKSGYGPAANNLAFILAENDQTVREALDLAQLAMKKMPDDPKVKDTLGWIHYRMGNFYKAIAELERCLAITPDNALANYHIGLAYYQSKEFNKARTHLKKALALNPNFDGAKDARALLDQ